MDGSFLSDPGVIKASRNYVCIRLATYESAQEAAVLKEIWTSRSGELENTVFAILTPDAKRHLVRAGRSPSWAFGESPEKMASTMNRLARRYSSGGRARVLPVIKDVRLALNVSACDQLPVVIGCAMDEKQMKTMEKSLAKLAWDDAFAGRFSWVVTTNVDDLKPLQGRKSRTGIFVVQPDPYGVKADVLAEIPHQATPARMKKALAQALKKFDRKPKDVQRHIRTGRRSGVRWKTEIPVTDSHSPQNPNRRRDRRRN